MITCYEIENSERNSLLLIALVHAIKRNTTNFSSQNISASYFFIVSTWIIHINFDKFQPFFQKTIPKGL